MDIRYRSSSSFFTLDLMKAISKLLGNVVIWTDVKAVSEFANDIFKMAVTTQIVVFQYF
jgi:hypothetical protein